MGEFQRKSVASRQLAQIRGHRIATNAKVFDHLVFDVVLPPSFIKVGIEGAEFAFLRDAERAISPLSPRMIMEVHSDLLEGQRAEFLEHRGYRRRIVSAWFREYRPIVHKQWLCVVRE